MEEFYIEYFIENIYETPARKANFQLLVLPDPSMQNVSELKISCSDDQEIFLSPNIFGFQTINFYISKPFTHFWFKLSALVEKPKINPFYISPLLPEDEFKLLNSSDFQIDNHLFLASTDLTKMPAAVNCTFPEYTGDGQIFEYLLSLTSFLYQMLEYSPESTDVNTPIAEVLQIRKGVCQDYAHLFISVCRQNKIPARYVSGYLNQGVGFTGTSQLHAWAEALIPDLDWIGFDATNNLVADHHYIKIAHGTDYRDCSPIIGVLENTGAQKSIHSVIVSSNQ